ncbi:MAG: hypothetical protein ACLQLH_17275, partial [Terracidiphilus sp.]
NISLINRRHYLPRLLLTPSSKRQKQKPPQRFEDVDRVTPYHFHVAARRLASSLRSGRVKLRQAIIALSYENAISNSALAEDAQHRLFRPSHFSGAIHQPRHLFRFSLVRRFLRS